MLTLVKIVFILAFLVASYTIYTFYFPSSYDFLDLEIKGHLASEKENASFFPFIRPSLSFPTLLHLIHLAEKDPKIKGISFKIGNLEAGWGKLEELRQAILNVTKKGKLTVAYLEQAGNRDYYLATACNRIMIAPAGALNITGMRMEVLFFSEALEKLGIQPNISHIGKYKSTSEAFTLKEMSQPHREALEAILTNIFDHYADAIAVERNLAPELIRNLIDQAPFTAEEALQAKLTDSILYEDQIPDYLKELSLKKPKFINAYKYLKTISGRAWISGFFKFKPKIALIYATGVILPGHSRSLPFLGSVMGEETMVNAIRKVRKNKDIKAVVMRVESRGGSILSSDNIWREVVLTKEIKPFIISMGDLAASGGYYISAGATKILADPGTITGSIGIVFGKVALAKLYEKLGLRKDFLSVGKNAGIFSDYDPFTPEQKEKLRTQMEHAYKVFLQKVAQGRGIPLEEVEKIAQGRAWVGQQAKEIKLIDQLGGLNDAIAVAKEMAKIPKEREIKLLTLPERKRGYRWILERFLGSSENPSQELAQLLAISTMTIQDFAPLSEPVLALSPYLCEIH